VVAQVNRVGARRGGVIVRIDGVLHFVPASVAVRIAPPPRVTSVPGAPPDLLGIAPYEGTTVPVIAIGSARREMVVCQHAGELVGLVGGEVLQTGSFDSLPGRPEAVDFEGERVQVVDLSAIYARVQASARPGRWAR
jgi:chemotaxis signal transduction protein